MNEDEIAAEIAAYRINFKVGVLLKQAREKAGMTQDQVARRLRTKKSAIPRTENHAEDVRRWTIQKDAKAPGKNLRVGNCRLGTATPIPGI